MARGLAEHALELAPELARIEQRGERVAAGICLGLAEPRPRLRQRGAQQRILVVSGARRASRASGVGARRPSATVFRRRHARAA